MDLAPADLPEHITIGKTAEARKWNHLKVPYFTFGRCDKSARGAGFQKVAEKSSDVHSYGSCVVLCFS